MKIPQLLTASLSMGLLLVLGVGPRALAQDKSTDAGIEAAAKFDAVAASRGDNQATTDLSARFTTLAGSPDNARNLITGLRTGGEVKLITLVDAKPTTNSFQPATGKMGYGNVFLSLALAQETLAAQGVANPTPEQLQAALNGGTLTLGSSAEVKTVVLPGVLSLRNSGQGWGQIAQQLNVKLGHVVSDLRSATPKVDRIERPNAPGKPDKVEHVDRPQRIEKPEALNRPERPIVPQRPESHGRPGR